jgi:site-specific recombinase XerD
MEEQVVDYLHFLTIERGLAQNTRKSYQRDLERYLVFLNIQKIDDWNKVDRFTVVQFLQELQEEKKSPAYVDFINFFVKNVSLTMIQCNILILLKKPKSYLIH